MVALGQETRAGGSVPFAELSANSGASWQEAYRHTGHADLIRETIDGLVGEDPPGAVYPYERVPKA